MGGQVLGDDRHCEPAAAERRLLIVVLCVPMLMIPGFVTSGVLPF
ncbi:hypothetical protein [Streptomyces sp. NPDC055992]